MNWNTDNSKIVYGIGKDDLYYLDISNDGELVLTLDDNSISFSEIIEKVANKTSFQEESPSFTLRLPQLIISQIGKIMTEFEMSINECDYKGIFKPLYPIKVNQHKREVTTVTKANNDYGLEAGTKSELILILKVFREEKERIIMCNGVKDEAYIQIVKQALDEGYRIYISIESLTELKHVVKHIPKDQLNLILRIKPYVTMHGYWGSSSGRNSKFGLSISDLNSIIELIKEYGVASRLLGIHAHPGSQVTSVGEITKYFDFLINTFIELKQDGFENMRILNVGGGLPIDYDGRLPSENVRLYIRTLMKKIVDEFEKNNLNHPNIMIEAGRAITALSAILVIQPLEYHNIFPKYHKDDFEQLATKYPELNNINSVDQLIEFWKNWYVIPTRLNLTGLEKHEKETGLIKYFLRKKFFKFEGYEEYLDNKSIQKLIAADDFLLGNFSVFNGVCDHVMIDQYFPIIPTMNLDEHPTKLIRLVDITCDSDGEISIFRTKKSEKQLKTFSGVPLTSDIQHEWKGFPIANEENILNNYITIPLVGAYQDIIEFDHNLIGDLQDVELIFNEDGDFEVSITTHAQNIEDLLKEVGYTIENKTNPYLFVDNHEEDKGDE